MARLGRKEYVEATNQEEWVGVSTYDVARAIVAGTQDVAYLCIHPNVNKWSEFKSLDDPRTTPFYSQDFKNYKQGVVSKPFGLSMPIPTVGKYSATLQASMGEGVEHLVVDKLNEASVWEYAQPKKSDEVIGYIDGEPIYALQNDCSARIDDFAGYEHDAQPLFNVEWSGVNDIVCKVTIGSKEGGVTLEDMGLEGKILNLIAVSKNKMPIQGSINDNRYTIGINVSTSDHPEYFMSKSLNKETLTYIFTLPADRLDHILNDMVLFLVVTDRPLHYDLNYESIDGGIGINPDGYKNGNTYYFPIVDNAQDITELCVVENSFKEVKMSGGIGNVLWGNRAKNGGYYGIGVPSTNGGVVNYKRYSQMRGYNPSSDVYFELDSTNSSFTVKITDLGYSESKSALRKFSITGQTYDAATSSSYLNYFADNQTKGTVVYKPLLKDLSVNDRWGMYIEASIYIKLVYGDNLQSSDKSLVIRYTLFDGTTSEHILFSGKWNDYDDEESANYLYHSITMCNVVDVFNNVVGFKLVLKRTSGLTLNTGKIKETVIDTWYSDNDVHHYPIFPKVRVDAENPEVIKNYGDLYFGLPDDLNGAALLGRFRASYEVIDSDTISSIGV